MDQLIQGQNMCNYLAACSKCIKGQTVKVGGVRERDLTEKALAGWHLDPLYCGLWWQYTAVCCILAPNLIFALKITFFLWNNL